MKRLEKWLNSSKESYALVLFAQCWSMKSIAYNVDNFEPSPRENKRTIGDLGGNRRIGRTAAHIHFKVLSLTYNSMQSSKPTHLRELFTIQPTRSYTRSSSCLTLSRPPVTSHLMFSNRAISITAPRLWNDLPPELRTI